VREFLFKPRRAVVLFEHRPDVQWKNLVNQSEGLWPGILEKVRQYENEPRPVIFEGVNLLPHLAHMDLPGVPGIAILGSSLQETLKRNTERPRWGNTLELQTMEAEAFFNIERPRYEQESKKYGCQTFDTAEAAWATALNFLQ